MYSIHAIRVIEVKVQMYAILDSDVRCLTTYAPKIIE